MGVIVVMIVAFSVTLLAGLTRAPDLLTRYEHPEAYVIEEVQERDEAR